MNFFILLHSSIISPAHHDYYQVSSAQQTLPPSPTLMAPTVYPIHYVYQNSGNVIGCILVFYHDHHEHTTTIANSTTIFCLYNVVRLMLTFFSLEPCQQCHLLPHFLVSKIFLLVNSFNTYSLLLFCEVKQVNFLVCQEY